MNDFHALLHGPRNDGIVVSPLNTEKIPNLLFLEDSAKNLTSECFAHDDSFTKHRFTEIV
jgi:hypothetical protein